MCRPTSAESSTNQVSSDPVVGNLQENKSGNAATIGHPVRLDEFYKSHPSFVWGPILVAAFLHGITFIPQLASYLEAHQMQAFGCESALQYTVFAILASYAFHGWCSTHAPHRLKIQSAFPYEVSPSAMAVRSTATLLTQLVYSFLPLAPASQSWWQFGAWMAALNIYWDAHFYVVHRWAHENKKAYKFFHKTHHLCKEPNCFGAYFVTYQSHIVLEQLVVFVMAMAGLPRDVFLLVMYWGTIGSFVEHSGFELGEVKLLTFFPITFGHFCTLMSLPTAWLPGVNVAEHDWHHEKFFKNYSLSYKYLDKVFGTYHAGRVPGERQVVSGSGVRHKGSNE
jgi:sterol desaturase/sphingolipid hydroxylase (fatty acid hydroxylase superfamily)